MGLIYDNFKDKVLDLWNLANTLDKPIHPDITWTCGIIKGRADFLDLQVEGLALAASIIITEPVVPKIIFAWDCATDPNTNRKNNEARIAQFPLYLLRAMPDWKEEYLINDSENYYKSYKFSTRYFDLHRSALSINNFPWSLGLGYRSKYLGMNYVTTKYGIISDIDTICLAPCIEYLESKIKESPKTFIWTNHKTDTNLSVGLCLYNMKKYRNIFIPKLYEIYWSTHRQDSQFVPEVIAAYPELKKVLNVGLFNGEVLNSERFYKFIPRKNRYKEGITTHYHSWKREYSKDNGSPEKFINFYNDIINNLENIIKEG